MHVVYHPSDDVPRCVEITPSTVNDVEIGRQTELEAGATYVARGERSDCFGDAKHRPMLSG
jgi:hypothetical protein